MPAEGIKLPLYHGVGEFDSEAEADLEAILDHRYVAYDLTKEWSYFQRRSAQEIVPYLFLGPATAKTPQFFAENEITLILAIRDTSQAEAGVLGPGKVASELGIEFQSVDIANQQEFIKAFGTVNRIINEHLLCVYREQKKRDPESLVQQKDSNGRIIDTVKGKVLVYCETGNERSATVVAAYLMSMYGLTVIHAVQFVASQRFCIAIDDKALNLLVSFHDIIKAKRDVMTIPRVQVPMPFIPGRFGTNAFSSYEIPSGDKAKRVYNDTIEDMDMAEADDDAERFNGRNSAPFVDSVAQ
jgi:hypothetical protein